MGTKEKNLLDLLESETARMCVDCTKDEVAQIQKLKLERSVACEKISRDILNDIRSTLAGYSAWSDDLRVEFTTEDRRERDRYGNRVLVNMAKHPATKGIQKQIDALELRAAAVRERIKKTLQTTTPNNRSAWSHTGHHSERRIIHSRMKPMTDPKHKSTLDKLRSLGAIRAEGAMLVAGGNDLTGWRIGTAFCGIPSVYAADVAALVADLLNDALRDSLNA